MIWRAPVCVLLTGVLLALTGALPIEGTLGALTTVDSARGVVASGRWGTPTPTPTPRPCEFDEAPVGDGTRVELPVCAQVLGVPVQPRVPSTQVSPPPNPTPPSRPAPQAEAVAPLASATPTSSSTGQSWLSPAAPR